MTRVELSAVECQHHPFLSLCAAASQLKIELTAPVQPVPPACSTSTGKHHAHTRAFLLYGELSFLDFRFLVSAMQYTEV